MPILDQLDPPLLSAAGALNFFEPEAIVRETAELCRTAIGGVTLGSFTIPPQPGNEVTYGSAMFYVDDCGHTYNTMGLPNPGVDAACELAPRVVELAERAGKLAIFSCAPTLGPGLGDSISQATYLVKKLLATPAHLVELNVSCPNLVNEHTSERKPIMGYDLRSMQKLVAKLAMLPPRDKERLGLKLPPYLNDEQKRLVPQIATLLNQNGACSFITVPNTIPGQMPLLKNGDPALKLPGNTGGMSGPATAAIGREQLALWREHFTGDIISTLGVHDGTEMATRLEMGAIAVGGVSFLWNARRPAEGVEQLLRDYAERT